MWDNAIACATVHRHAPNRADVEDVDLHGVLADAEVAADLLVGSAAPGLKYPMTMPISQTSARAETVIVLAHQE